MIRKENTLKEENENLRTEVIRLQLHQTIAKIKMEAFSDHSKRNKDILKDIKNRFPCYKDELRDALKEIQRLLNQVTKMDKEINTLGGKLQNSLINWKV